MNRVRHRTLALPLAVGAVGLVVYASLYPFSEWRSQGMSPWSFLAAPWPQYWTAFDVVSNLLGYLPLGFLWALTMVRLGLRRWVWPVGVGLPAALSLVMEAVQNFLPMRVPSQVDALLNVLGAFCGVVLVVVLSRWRMLAPWNHFRERCLVSDTAGGFLVLVLWPWAVLYPTPIPFGLGQVWWRVEAALPQLLEGTPFEAWLPASAPVNLLSPLAEAVVVALCLGAPLLLGYALLRGVAHRLVFALLWAVLAPMVMAVSAILTYGPEHMWGWLAGPVWLGMVVAAGMAFWALAWSHRACAVLLLMSLTWALVLLNQSSESAYFAQSLQTWEQGRFIRFHGLSQWVGWLWPYAALWVALRLALRRSSGHYNSAA
jgi:VanZ family protein